MVLCGKNADRTRDELIRPHPDSKIGERVLLNGIDILGNDQYPKRKSRIEICKEFFPKIDRNKHLEVVFNGINLTTSAGAI